MDNVTEVIQHGCVQRIEFVWPVENVLGNLSDLLDLNGRLCDSVFSVRVKTPAGERHTSIDFAALAASVLACMCCTMARVR